MIYRHMFYKISRDWLLYAILICVGTAVYFVLGNYEIQFSKTASRFTNFIIGNGWQGRTYDEYGIPYSRFARLRIKTTSPYYVVHNGLIFSQTLTPPAEYNWLWREDDSFKMWGEDPPPNLITKDNFIHAAEWILQRLEKDEFGNTHIYYHFNWPYKGTSQGFLQAPWYSGLTDSVAIKLFLRAHVVTGDLKYLRAADALYQSVITPIEQGGSLFYDDDGNPWIEEYVAKNNTNMPMVLNGMVYATFAISDYERFVGLHHTLSNKLINTIRVYAEKYDTGYWTKYDLIGTLTKPKYHFIHVALMEMLYNETKDEFFCEIAAKWDGYNTHFITRYFLKRHITVNSLVVLFFAFALWISASIIIYLVIRMALRGWRWYCLSKIGKAS